jgi:nucleoid-associated protein YgaU
VDAANPGPDRRTLTPAVVTSALFAAACAVFAVAFVSARGGLQLPAAGSPPPVAVATAEATTAPTDIPAAATPAPSPSPSSALPAATPIVPPPTPRAFPTAPTPGGPSLAPNDPLLSLPGCPGLPGCFEYTVRRGDSLSGIAGRYLLPLSTVRALNPEIADPSVVVAGEIVYLGHDAWVRLPPCPGIPDCSLYTVQPGDGLSAIATRFGITVDAILAANPQITNPNLISSGQVIHLPHPAA